MNFTIYPLAYLVYRFSSALTRLSCFARSALHDSDDATFRPKLKWKRPLVFSKTKCKVEVCKACPAIVIVDGGRMIVHVADMMVVAPKHWLMKVFIPFMEERFDCTWELATNSGDTVSFLKRKHTVTDSGVIIHGQPELFDKMCDVLGVSAKRTSKSPCTRELVKDIDSPQLDPERASKFRTAIGIAMYASTDRSDACFAIRTLAQRLSHPTEFDWTAAQKLASYLRCTKSFATHVEPGFLDDGLARSTFTFFGQRHSLEVYSDSDWCGNRKNRRSMSGGVFYLDQAVIYTTCRSQKCISLSSCEAEWYAATTAACDMLYIGQCLQTLLGEPVDMTVRLDNSAARSLAFRTGASGKTRHMDARYLWCQEKVKAGALTFRSVPGEMNPGDISTKVLSENRCRALLGAQKTVDVDTMEHVGEREWRDVRETTEMHRQVRSVQRSFAKVRTNDRFVRMMVLAMMVSGATADTTGYEFSPKCGGMNIACSGIVTVIACVAVLSLGSSVMARLISSSSGATNWLMATVVMWNSMPVCAMDSSSNGNSNGSKHPGDKPTATYESVGLFLQTIYTLIVEAFPRASSVLLNIILLFTLCLMTCARGRSSASTVTVGLGTYPSPEGSSSSASSSSARVETTKDSFNSPTKCSGTDVHVALIYKLQREGFWAPKQGSVMLPLNMWNKMCIDLKGSLATVLMLQKMCHHSVMANLGGVSNINTRYKPLYSSQ